MDDALHISSKIADWFSNKQKKEDVEGLFEALTNADNEMFSFTYDEVVGRLGTF